MKSVKGEEREMVIDEEEGGKAEERKEAGPSPRCPK